MDSGVGGLSVLKEVRRLLPGLDLIYYADSAYCPYGDRSAEYVTDRCRKITGHFIGRGCVAVVVACNTATAAAIETLRREYDLPFVGMEPAVKPAALGTSTGVIGVLATAGTLRGSKYLHTKGRFGDDVKIVEKVGQGFVELVEGGELSGEHVETVVRESIQPLLDASADRIVLGCTHYPFLRPVMEKIAGGSVEIVDPAPAVALQLSRVLEDRGIGTSGTGTVTLESSGDDTVLKKIYSMI